MDLEEIMNKIRMLNKRETLPLTGLQLNSIYYRLISYINNSICLFISESYDDVALFLKRADEEIRILKTKDVEHKKYFVSSDYFVSCE
ncbi:hypothetical protein HQN89_31610 [Paenibacillus frigoriresistens]|uniref:hypothetical protein n=1 Tax=Paenibacillus alginolyticus TaxID=59839 RepID=UPI001565A5EA|nr:hypothetical protein [Paenibacillus frigoriresistens]NRF95421.1 hypothetical protein [Paenibacillus frigoriresistens]